MRKTTISTLTLATLLYFSTNSALVVDPVYAASKSAISPDLVVSQPVTNIQDNIQSNIQAQPAIAPTNIEIKLENNANLAPANNLTSNLTNNSSDLSLSNPRDNAIDNSENNSIKNRESIQVNIETRINTSAVPSSKTPSKAELRQPVEPVEVVLENRSTGCKFKASSLLERNADLCNPQVAIRQNNSPNYPANNGVLYAVASEDNAIEVRRLTAKEIAAMSLPSNGDKQMLFPLIAPSIISSLFGSRLHPITGQVRFHQGTDLAAPAGTPVLAAFSGRIEIAGWLGGYGLIVVISHGDTHETRYAHLSEVLVKAGQEVKQGTVIGLVGSTGLATGPHLHFELWRRMQDELVAIDPTPQLLIAMEQLEKYLAQSPKSLNRA